MLISMLQRKAASAGGGVIEIKTRHTRLSQFDHTTGEYIKKPLSQRVQGSAMAGQSRFNVISTARFLRHAAIRICSTFPKSRSLGPVRNPPEDGDVECTSTCKR